MHKSRLTRFAVGLVHRATVRQKQRWAFQEARTDLTVSKDGLEKRNASEDVALLQPRQWFEHSASQRVVVDFDDSHGSDDSERPLIVDYCDRTLHARRR